MEVDEQVMTGCALEQVETVVHVTLVVAGEEVDLHAGHAQFLTPGKLALAVLGLIQPELGRGGTVDPPYRRIVPDHGLHTLQAGIGNGVFNGLAVLHRVPFGINEHIGQVKHGSHIDIFLDDLIVVRAMIVGPVNPRHDAGLNPTYVGYLAGLTNVGDERRLHYLGQGADNGHTPGSVPAAFDTHFVLVRYHAEKFALIVEARGTLLPLDIGLAEEDKHTVGRLQQGWVAPPAVVAVRRGKCAAKGAYRLHFVGISLGEEALVAVCPLLHPTACALANAIGRQLLGQFS